MAPRAAVLAADLLPAAGWSWRSSIPVRDAWRWASGKLLSGNGNKRRSAAVQRCVSRARANVNGNEEPSDAKPRQVPNKGLQLTRALGAGAYSLVGWAGPRRS